VESEERLELIELEPNLCVEAGQVLDSAREDGEPRTRKRNGTTPA
jgi:hypothetical protein